MLSSSFSRFSLVLKSNAVTSGRQGLASLYVATRNYSSGELESERNRMINEYVRHYLEQSNSKHTSKYNPCKPLQEPAQKDQFLCDPCSQGLTGKEQSSFDPCKPTEGRKVKEQTHSHLCKPSQGYSASEQIPYDLRNPNQRSSQTGHVHYDPCNPYQESAVREQDLCNPCSSTAVGYSAEQPPMSKLEQCLDINAYLRRSFESWNWEALRSETLTVEPQIPKSDCNSSSSRYSNGGITSGRSDLFLSQGRNDLNKSCNDPCKSRGTNIDPCYVDPYKSSASYANPCKSSATYVDPCKSSATNIDPCKSNATNKDCVTYGRSNGGGIMYAPHGAQGELRLDVTANMGKSLETWGNQQSSSKTAGDGPEILQSSKSDIFIGKSDPCLNQSRGDLNKSSDDPCRSSVIYVDPCKSSTACDDPCKSNASYVNPSISNQCNAKQDLNVDDYLQKCLQTWKSRPHSFKPRNSRNSQISTHSNPCAPSQISGSSDPCGPSKTSAHSDPCGKSKFSALPDPKSDPCGQSQIYSPTREADLDVTAHLRQNLESWNWDLFHTPAPDAFSPCGPSQTYIPCDSCGPSLISASDPCSSSQTAAQDPYRHKEISARDPCWPRQTSAQNPCGSSLEQGSFHLDKNSVSICGDSVGISLGQSVTQSQSGFYDSVSPCGPSLISRHLDAGDKCSKGIDILRFPPPPVQARVNSDLDMNDYLWCLDKGICQNPICECRPDGHMYDTWEVNDYKKAPLSVNVSMRENQESDYIYKTEEAFNPSGPLFPGPSGYLYRTEEKENIWKTVKLTVNSFEMITGMGGCSRPYHPKLVSVFCDVGGKEGQEFTIYKFPPPPVQTRMCPDLYINSYVWCLESGHCSPLCHCGPGGHIHRTGEAGVFRRVTLKGWQEDDCDPCSLSQTSIPCDPCSSTQTFV